MCNDNPSGPRRYVLCVLSLMRSGSLPYLYTYEGTSVAHGYGNGNGRYEGIQTNVGPVECLIDLSRGKANGEPRVTKVIYLCSSECRTRGVTGIAGMPDVEMSTEEYFRSVILDYYRACFGSDSASISEEDLFVALDYTPSNPAENLQLVLDALGDDDVVVDIDTTGGLRDAVNLLTLAVEVLQCQSRRGNASQRHPRLGTTVYAQSIKPPIPKELAPGLGNISVQNQTYRLSELISAVDAFVSFGKAGKVRSYFTGGASDEVQPSRELVSLCVDLGRFSDNLSLCIVNGLLDLVVKIHRDLDALEAANRRRSNRRLIYGRVLERLDSEPPQKNFKTYRARVLGITEGGVQDRDVRAHLESLGLERNAIDEVVRAKSANALSRSVERLHSESVVGRDETLFCSLIPSIRADFVGGGTDPSSAADSLLVETIRWCVRREMLQQALALFKEQAPTYMERMEYVSWVDEGGLDAKSLQRSRVERFVWLCGCGLPLVKDESLLRQHHMRVEPNGLPVLPSIIFWYATLNTIRNDVMHQREQDSSPNLRELERQLLGNYRLGPEDKKHLVCRYAKNGSTRALGDDILDGLLALEGGIVLEEKY